MDHRASLKLGVQMKQLEVDLYDMSFEQRRPGQYDETIKILERWKEELPSIIENAKQAKEDWK